MSVEPDVLADPVPAALQLGEPLSSSDGNAAAMQLGRRVGTGAMWNALNTGVLRASSFLVGMLVARLVAPHDFGVFTVAWTVFNVAVMLTELGVVSALIREHDRSRELAPTAYTVSLLSGATIAAVMVIFAPFFARELGAEQAAGAVRVLSLIALLAGFSAVPVALLSRDFMQRQQFTADAAFFVVSTTTLLALVLAGHPVMGLAWSQVAGQLVSVALLMWMAPEKYWPRFHWTTAKHLLAFGLPLAGSQLVAMAMANVDFVVVGHFLGPTKLGFYNLAFNIANWPFTIFTAVLLGVTLPTLSRARHSQAELTRHTGAALSALSMCAFPVCALMSALALPLIGTVYGPRWHVAWTALVILTILGAARTVFRVFADLLVALGMTRRLLAIQCCWLVALSAVMVLSVKRWGIFGAGVAHALVVVVIVLPLCLWTVRRRTPVGLAFVLPSTLRPLLGALGAAAAAYTASRMADGEAWQLLLGIVAGMGVYALLTVDWLLKVGRSLRAMYWRPPVHATEPPGHDSAAASVAGYPERRSA